MARDYSITPHRITLPAVSMQREWGKFPTRVVNTSVVDGKKKAGRRVALDRKSCHDPSR